MADALLHIAGLEAGYGAGTVLHGVDLTVAEGEAVAVLGRNGVGKTTLMKTVMGLLRPRAGTIRFAGAAIGGLPPYAIARAGIGYVPQGRAVFAELSVEENLLLGDLRAPDAGRAWRLFPMLAERRREPAGRLSGGQQQQLALARALMGRPRLLLLDEPSEGLQPSVVLEIADTLAAVAAAEGLALVLVEQNIDLALRLAGRAAFMDRGRVVAAEGVAGLRAEPARLDALLAL